MHSLNPGEERNEDLDYLSKNHTCKIRGVNGSLVRYIVLVVSDEPPAQFKYILNVQ